MTEPFLSLLPAVLALKKARDRILSLTETAEVGKIYTGKCARSRFRRLHRDPARIDGLVHVSQLASERVEKVEDVVNVGDELTVMVIDVSPEGKIRLSRKALLEGWTADGSSGGEHDNANRSKSSGGSRGGHSGGDRRSGGDRQSGGRYNDRSSGGDRRSGGSDSSSGGDRRPPTRLIAQYQMRVRPAPPFRSHSVNRMTCRETQGGLPLMRNSDIRFLLTL